MAKRLGRMVDVVPPQIRRVANTEPDVKTGEDRRGPIRELLLFEVA